MAKSRIIFTLLVNENKYMLSRNFNLQSVGNLDWLKKMYDFNAISCSIDELMVLNVSRNPSDPSKITQNIVELTKNCFMPISVGGWVRTIADVKLLMRSGADKIVLSTPFFRDPKFVSEVVESYGSQCVVACLDYQRKSGESRVFIEHGTQDTGMRLDEALDLVISLGAGEVILNSIAQDGTGQGLDLPTIAEISERSQIPVIASGGVGKFDHFVSGIRAGASAVSTANLFNFMADGLTAVRMNAIQSGIDLAKWEFTTSTWS